MSGAAITSGMAARVTGAARGAADVMLPGMLQGRILTSPHPHATIRRIDLSKAYSLPGVVAVLTHADCPVSDGDRPLLAGTACFEGEWIAAVAAESPIAAEDALNLIDIDFDILPAHTDPLRRENDTSVLPHSDQPGGGSHEVTFSGIASRSLRTDFALQTAVARVDSSGELAIEAATNGDMAIRLCRIAILLARRSARPVKLVEPEGVDLYARRSTSLHRVMLRAGAEGRLTLAEHEAVVDAGAYPLSPVVTDGDIPALAGALAFSAAHSRVSKIKTNTRPKDGLLPGNEEGGFIFQQALDMMAEKTGLDPVEFRIRNRLPGDDGQRMEDCLRAGAMRFGWSHKWRGWNNGTITCERYRQGVGLSILSRGKPGALFGHQADFVEIEVDIETGVTVLLSHVCALDVTGLPQAPDPTTLQAAFVAGIGNALLEEAAPASWGAVPDKAVVLFRVPSIMDTLEVDCIFTSSLVSPDATISPVSDEAGFVNLAPAIANAVYDAVGIRLRELPLSPERVLRSLREKSTAGSSDAGRRVS